MITDKDLDAFGYWEMVDAYPAKEQDISYMVEEYRVTSGQEKDRRMAETLIKEEYNEWWNEKSGTAYDLKELADLVYVIFGYANVMGYDLMEAVRRVHENNMARMFQSDGTIKRRADGKIEKNPDTPKVQLEDLV